MKLASFVVAVFSLCLLVVGCSTAETKSDPVLIAYDPEDVVYVNFEVKKSSITFMSELIKKLNLEEDPSFPLQVKSIFYVTVCLRGPRQLLSYFLHVMKENEFLFNGRDPYFIEERSWGD